MSNKETPKKERQGSVTKGSVKVKKPNELVRAAKMFVADDIDDLKGHILHEVVVPTFKRLITDTIDTVLYGSVTRPKNSGGTFGRSANVSYNNMYKQPQQHTKASEVTKRASEVESVVFATKMDAQATLNSLHQILEEFEMVSVFDYYDISGLYDDGDFKVNHTHHKYGWMALDNVTIAGGRDGYVLNLPKVKPL